MNTSLLPILIVEDDEVFLNVLVTQLSGVGWEVRTATSVEQACQLLHQERMSLVLLDWNLSNASGGGGAATTGSVVIKTSREVDPLIPVIVMSGERAFDVRTDAVLHEADSYLEKPFSMSLLVGHVSRWLKRCDVPTAPTSNLSISSLLDN